MNHDELAQVGLATFTASSYRPGPVTHIVLFRYAASTTLEQRAEVSRRFHALAGSEREGAPYVLSIESGGQVSLESAAAPFDDAFIVRFASLGDRNFYVGEPIVTNAAFFDASHARFKEFVGPLLAENGALVFDLQSTN